MKKKFIHILFSIVIMFISGMAIHPCGSEVVWSEDFEDGDFDGWTVTQGDFTVENGYLESVAQEITGTFWWVRY